MDVHVCLSCAELHVCVSHPHRRVSCWVVCLCVLLVSVSVSVRHNVFAILSYSYQSMLCLNLSLSRVVLCGSVCGHVHMCIHTYS